MHTSALDYISEEKRESLLAELAELKGVKRREILENLEYAKSLGDLSENAEYHQAREEQAKLEERIAKIEEILRSSVVIKEGTTGTVGMGSEVVVLKDGTKEEKTFKIVGSEEADMALGRISNRSPLGSAMLGKEKGETVSISAPSGAVNYKIIKVS